MRKSQIIKKFLTAFLLVVFAIGATPKIYLHLAFANHKDSKATTDHDKFHKEKIGLATIHCQCDDLVVEAPFISAGQNIKVAIANSFIIKFSEASNSFVSTSLLSFGLRGPPPAFV